MAIAEQSLDRVRDLVQPGELLAQLPPVEAAPTELQFSVSPGGQVEGDVSVNSADRQLPAGNASRNARRNAQGSPAQQQGYYGIPSGGLWQPATSCRAIAAANGEYLARRRKEPLLHSNGPVATTSSRHGRNTSPTA